MTTTQTYTVTGDVPLGKSIQRDFTRAATIGPQSWRNTTLRNIRLAQTVARKSEHSVQIGKSADPLPNLRDVTAQLTNEGIHQHNREARTVLAKLRASLLEINEEIKSLLKTKNQLDKWHDNIRKDLQVNKESMALRTRRPPAEKEHDGADDLLAAERSHLKNLKRTLETQLQLINQHLQVMDKARLRLFLVSQERSRILDLICHTISMRNQPVPGTAPLKDRPSPTRQMYASNPLIGDTTVVCDPLGTYSKESDSALHDMMDAKTRSVYLREETADLINRTMKLQAAAHSSVNSGVTQKLAETIALKGHLTMGLGENKHYIQKAQKWYDATEIARKRTLGPESSKELTTREQLNRPIVRVYQRHPGNQVPEGRTIANTGEQLLQSMTATSRNIGLMNLTQDRLEADHRGKHLASSIDADVIRLRRRKNNHRWAMGSAK